MSLKRNLKRKFGVDLDNVIERFNEKSENKEKRKFDWDTDDLDPWESNTLPNVITDLIANSEFLSMLALEEGVKGTRKIALLNGDVALKEREGCDISPDGALIFTDRDLTVKNLLMAIELCNEDLNRKMTEVLNVIGVTYQNGQLPAELEDIILAYLIKMLNRKAQRVVLNGDTTSLDAELALFDGLRKIINDSAEVEVYTSSETAVTNSNAYDLAYGVYTSIPSEVLEEESIRTILVMGRTEALRVLKSWNDNNPYNLKDIPVGGGSMRFQLPLTEIEIVTVPEYNNTGDMHAMPMNLAFLGTDSEEDMNFQIKYNEWEDKLRAQATFRLGTNIVWDKYFTRLELNVVS